jgi:hypothetical protein
VGDVTSKLKVSHGWFSSASVLADASRCLLPFILDDGLHYRTTLVNNAPLAVFRRVCRATCHRHKIPAGFYSPDWLAPRLPRFIVPARCSFFRFVRPDDTICLTVCDRLLLQNCSSNWWLFTVLVAVLRFGVLH